jgi:hypothetical protein
MATPAQQQIVHPTIAEMVAAGPLDPISQQIADLAAREDAKTAEETARAEKIAAINRIETGGLTLCGIKVSEAEMAEYIRSGVVPARILKPQETDE